jgi:hypothetical protein
MPMQERGRLQPGMIADITIFNPDTIADTSTMKIGERGSYTAGIPYVMVNGQIIIDEGVANTELRAGQPIRYDVITEGKIGDVVDLEDKEFQWHSDLPGYPATRFPPNEMNPPSPNELDPENNQASISQPGETKLASQSWKLDAGKEYVDMHYCPLDGLQGGNHEGHDHVLASLNAALK